jgi:O-antigen ligase
MSQALVFYFIALGALAVLGLFVWLERSGRSEVVFGIILVLLIVEVVLYPGQGDVPSVIFNPTVGGQAFRLPELTIPAALFARLLVHGLPRRLTPTDLAWAAFLLWWLEGTAVGLMGANPTKDVLFNGKAIIFIGGGYAVASRLDLSRLLSPRTCSWLIALLSAAAATLGFMTLTGRTVAVNLPLIPLDNFGPYQGDPSTIVWTLALPLALVEFCRRRPSALRVTALLLLVASPLAGNQRASLIGLAAAVLVAVAAMLLPTWRDRFTSRRMRVIAPAVGLVLVTTSGAALAVGLGSPASALASQVVTTFTAQGKQESAHDRLVLWSQAETLIAEKPLIGWGQGQWVTIPASRTVPAVRTPTHNIALDLLLRNGLVGLLLFLIALLLSVSDGLRVWRTHPDPRVAATALGCTAALIGFVSKGMVESVFDQVRLSTMFGFLIGFIACALRGATTQSVVEGAPRGRIGSA